MNKVASYIAAGRAAAKKSLNFVDDPAYRNRRFVNQPGMLNATGNPATSDIKKSQPYVVIVSSASGSAVQNFDILGAYQYINNAGFTAGGSLVIGSVTVSSGMAGVTYRDFLYQSMNNPFTIGLTYLQCANDASQVTQPLTITTQDANGTLVSVPIVPFIDPYQQQTNITVVNQSFRIDGFTKITFANIQPLAYLVVQLYPSANVNPARALSGAPSTEAAYGNPGVIRP